MHDVETWDSEPITRLLDGRQVACAESVTAGRIAGLLASAPHAQSFFRGGIVAYQEEVKRDLLGVHAAEVISEEAAAEMARGAADLLGADVALATTGLAASDPDVGEPGGTVYVASLVDGDLHTRCYRLEGRPARVCDAAARAALDQLRIHLRERHRAATDAPGDDQRRAAPSAEWHGERPLSAGAG